MTYKLCTGIILLACGSAFGQQWTNVGTNNIQNTNTDKVGVGVNASVAKFQVQSGNLMHGIYSETSASSMYSAIYGAIGNTANLSCAITALTYSPGGGGIFTLSGATSGNGAGMYSQTNSPDGYALVGRADHASGGIAVYGGVTASNAYALYTDGGRNCLTGNTGIGTAGPTAKLHVNGTVRFENTPTAKTGIASLALDSSGNVVQQAAPLSNGVKRFSLLGTSSWSVPAGITRVHIKMWGAGGAGIGTRGGGAGAYIETILDVSNITSLSVTVGYGGTGISGGDTTITPNTGSPVLTAGGGKVTTGNGGLASYTGTISPDSILSSGYSAAIPTSWFTTPHVDGPNVQGVTALGYRKVGYGGYGDSTFGTCGGGDGEVIFQW